MSPEREIVNLWLNRNGFFTVSGLNAGSRVVDFVALRHKRGFDVSHVQVSCSISSSVALERELGELAKAFGDVGVVSAVERCIEGCIGRKVPYERVLVTNLQNVAVPGVRVVRFEDVFFDVLRDLDRQRYKSQTIRAFQLVKFILLSDPQKLSALLARDSSYKAMTSPAKEELLRELLSQDSAKRLFRRQSSEQILVELLRVSSLRNPERLAAALEEMLTKRTGSRLLGLLMRRQGVRFAIKEELSKDRKLEQFFFS